MLDELSAQALDELRRDGFADDRIRIERALDLRYAGQGYEIAVPCPAAWLQVADLQELRLAFDRQHKAMFGHMAPEETVEIVSYPVRGIGFVPPLRPPRRPLPAPAPPPPRGAAPPA